MHRRTLFFLLTLIATPAHAADRSLTASETLKLLGGNTVLGSSEDKPTKQYFDPNGDTLYITADGARSEGRWRMDGDTYCSNWPPAEHWTCYAVRGDPDAAPPTIQWIDRAGFVSAGAVTPGNAMD